jgi:hypothetical protein
MTDVEAVNGAFVDCDALGLILGEASNGLVDVDLDHEIAWKMRSIFLPATRMRTGRAGNPDSHYWYRVTDKVPGYRKYVLPGGATTVELRSTGGHQTLIPPSKHPSGEKYRWEAEPWGGDEGPTEITGKMLAARVATMGMCAVLIENWPSEGSRHEAYLALAGGMLRLGSGTSVHPLWERQMPQIIEAMAEATRDKDGGHTRVAEVVPTTLHKIRAGAKVQGWPTLESIIGQDSARRARKYAEEVERILEWEKHYVLPSTGELLVKQDVAVEGGEDPEAAPVEVVDVNPLDARVDTWEPVNLEPYLAGEVTVPEPTVLRRSDGHGLFYPGRVNSLYGRSESAKSWIALIACLQEIGDGGSVVYVDLEDDPAMTLRRLRLLGAGDDDIRFFFTYIRPEGPHSHMQRDTWGNEKPTEVGYRNAASFEEALAKANPSLIVVDGMSVLYGLHGLNTNDVMSTDVITNWLKSVTRNGRTTVIVIDHTAKNAGKGASPIGSQHKVSMVQGTAMQVVPVDAPRPGVLGHVELVIGKDRPGGVRAVSSDEKIQVAADVFLDSRQEGVTHALVLPPRKGDLTVAAGDDADNRLRKVTQLRNVIEEFFAANPGGKFSISDIDHAIAYDGYSRGTLQNALKGMVSDGVLGVTGKTKARAYHSLQAPEEVTESNPEASTSDTDDSDSITQ